MTVWETYRKRFVATQILIGLVLGALFVVARLQRPEDALGAVVLRMAIYFVVLEAAGVAGAWWGSRLSRRIEQAERQPPPDQ
jgi:uncharacterized membrane protein YfcA